MIKKSSELIRGTRIRTLEGKVCGATFKVEVYTKRIQSGFHDI